MHTLGHPISCGTAALPRRAEVKCHIATDSEDIGLMIEDVCNLCVPQQRLRRNASDVVAHPAPILQLDDAGLQTQLCGTDRSDVTARASAQDDDLEVCTHGPTLGSPLGDQAVGLLWSWPVTERLSQVATSVELAIKSVSCPKTISYMSYGAWVTDND